MNQEFQGWEAVARLLKHRANEPLESLPEERLNQGQRASLRAIAERIVNNGVLIADEVGMGKTRIAVEIARSVGKAGGRVAILAPPGLGYQWQAELRDGGVKLEKGIVRSLYGYFRAWEGTDESLHKPWFNEPVVMISHGFANFRFGENSQSWRWSLLPELYAHWCKSKRNGRWPRYYNENNCLTDLWSSNAAASITAAIREKLKSDCIPWKFLNELDHLPNWTKMLDAGEYRNDGDLRGKLEKGVGLGFGHFDLIIIDEAHKNRREDSGLSRLLNNVILPSESSRRLALTATPIELYLEQWTETLGRLAIGHEQLLAIQNYCETYAKAVTSLRDNWPAISDEAFDKFKKSARAFEKILSPYLIRRDKREDEHVKVFEPMHAYRRQKELPIEVQELDAHWRMAICAAEALSFVACQKTDSMGKRLRLTLGNGQGLSAWLDQQKIGEPADGHQEMHDEEAAKEPGESLEESPADNADVDRRSQRAQWWSKVIGQAFEHRGSLYDHPAILKAVEEIERETANGEKVLVFGRFTKPMQALVDLLNAREMLRRVDTKRFWPESRIHDDDQPAARAAFKQLKERGGLTSLASLDNLEVALKTNYAADSRKRERFRADMIDEIKKGFETKSPSRRVLGLFSAFTNSVGSKSSGEDEGDLALVARALMESIDDQEDTGGPAPAFERLIDAVSDRDTTDEEEGDNDDGMVDDWREIVQRFQEEFDTTRGRFARFMYGGTSQHSRRMIQLAFNRAHSFPKVLVAQSKVGREGLNLHESCRIVLLLHPEWNPGVVEQQIGRVDRVGSHWSKELDKAIKENRSADDFPRIEVQPIIFRGTYDEHNWEVLKNRWDTLRSQLHGIIIAETEARDNAELKKRLQEINHAAPNFSPEDPCPAPIIEPLDESPNTTQMCSTS